MIPWKLKAAANELGTMMLGMHHTIVSDQVAGIYTSSGLSLYMDTHAALRVMTTWMQ